MKKLFLILAATAASMTFASKAQAQATDVSFPFYYHFSVESISSDSGNHTIELNFRQWHNHADMYTGQTAHDMLQWSIGYGHIGQNPYLRYVMWVSDFMVTDVDWEFIYGRATLEVINDPYYPFNIYFYDLIDQPNFTLQNYVLP